MLAGLVYALVAATAFLCASLLLRGYFASGVRLLLWAGVCFALLTLNNVLVFLDVLVIPQFDLYTWRNLAAVVGMGVLIYGLVWDAQ